MLTGHLRLVSASCQRHLNLRSRWLLDLLGLRHVEHNHLTLIFAIKIFLLIIIEVIVILLHAVSGRDIILINFVFVGEIGVLHLDHQLLGLFMVVGSAVMRVLAPQRSFTVEELLKVLDIIII